MLLNNIDKHLSVCKIFGFVAPTNIGIGTKFILLCILVPKICQIQRIFEKYCILA